MPSFLSRLIKIDFAEHFKEAFSANDHSFYFFLGKAIAWDSDPETPTDAIEKSNFMTWDRMIALKRLTDADVSFAIKKFTWQSGNVYRKWKSYVDVNINQSSSNSLYVVTSDSRVYKCINNNKGAASTVEPSQTDLVNTFKTSDGYEWKYMYPIVGSDQQRFISTEFIPIKTVTSLDSFNSEQFNIQIGAVDGTVDSIDIVNGGNNYINFSGNISAYSNSTVFFIANTVYGANRSDDDYYNECNMFVQSGGGRGQLVEILDYQAVDAKITLASALTTDLTVSTATDPSYIVIGPKITINGNGAAATAYANVDMNSSNTINYINMINKGTGYTSASITIEDSSFSGATGLWASATPNVSPVGGHGSNPLRELANGAMMISSRFRGDDVTDIINTTDFGMYGIIESPKYANGDVVTDTAIDNTRKLNLTGISGITNATAVNSWTVKGLTSFASAYALSVVTTTSGANAVLSITESNESNGVFVTSEVIQLNNDAGVFGTLSSITESIAAQDTGDVLYIENRELIQRSTTQSEDFKIVIQF